MLGVGWGDWISRGREDIFGGGEGVEGDVLDILGEKRVWWRVMIYKTMFVEREREPKKEE